MFSEDRQPVDPKLLQDKDWARDHRHDHAGNFHDGLVKKVSEFLLHNQI